MEFESSDYFTYKKSKMQTELKPGKKNFSRFNLMLQLFVTTFIIMFIVIVIAIMKYSSKMDIEYSQGDLSFSNLDSSPNTAGYNIVDYDEEQRKIDKRLILIQQEENAPSEAKILQKSKTADEVIAPEHVENSKKIDKIEKIKAKNAQSEKNESASSKIAGVLDEVKQIASKTQNAKNIQVDENYVVNSKVLIGKYSTFEQAGAKQSEIKAKDSKLSPFVRKIGDVYSIQMGSYQDFPTAKTHAQKLKAMGYDVWIYQQ